MKIRDRLLWHFFDIGVLNSILSGKTLEVSMYGIGMGSIKFLGRMFGD